MIRQLTDGSGNKRSSPYKYIFNIHKYECAYKYKYKYIDTHTHLYYLAFFVCMHDTVKVFTGVGIYNRDLIGNILIVNFNECRLLVN